MGELIYDYHKREPHNSWGLMQCEVLLEEAKKYSNTSFVLYAALEARNIIEKTEFDILLMASDKEDKEEIKKIGEGVNGLAKLNNKYKALNYRYQSFSEAYIKANATTHLKAYDYKKSEEHQKELAAYIHIYTRESSELEYSSDFIQNGIIVVNKAVAYIKSYYVKTHDGSYGFGMLNFASLNGSVKEAFDEWKKIVSNDTETLYQKLKAINETESGGEKLTF